VRDLQGVIGALGPRLSEARVLRDRRIEGVVMPGGALKLAQALRADFGVELRLMVGNDRRGDIGAFEVYYLFAHPTENWFVHARKILTAENPVVASLGTATLSAAMRGYTAFTGAWSHSATSRQTSSQIG
jgi:NADH:ubiquinone oxidoreductase subunit C